VELRDVFLREAAHAPLSLPAFVHRRQQLRRRMVALSHRVGVDSACRQQDERIEVSFGECWELAKRVMHSPNATSHGGARMRLPTA
jgi:hypothetical protein